jgi:hypothetical protein
VVEGGRGERQSKKNRRPPYGGRSEENTRHVRECIPLIRGALTPNSGDNSGSVAADQASEQDTWTHPDQFFGKSMLCACREVPEK